MYDEVGRNVAQGRGFVGGFSAETAYRPVHHDPDAPEIGNGPVYPVFLALLYRAGGHRIVLVRIAQAVIGALMLVPLYLLVKGTLGPVTARATTWLAALYPAFIIYAGFVLTEALATALLILTLWAVWVAWNSDRLWLWAVPGCLAGIATLLRAEFVSVFIVVGLVALWRAPSRRTVIGLAIAATATAAVMAPWVVRNYRLFHRFIPVSAHGGDTLWLAVKGWTEWRFGDPELQALVRGLDYLQETDAMREAALREIAADPVRFVRTRLTRFPDFWLTSHTSNVAGVTLAMPDYLARREVGPVVAKALLLALNMSLIAVGLAGLVWALWQRPVPLPDLLLLAAPIFCLSAVHLVLYAAPRYQVPMMPFMLTFAAWLFRTRRPGAPA